MEHDRVEKCLAGQDQVDDVGDEEAEDRDAQHDGIDDPEDVWCFLWQTDVHHPPSSAQARVSRSQTVHSSTELQDVPRLIAPLRQDQVRPSPRPLQPDVVMTEMVRVQLSLDNQLLLTPLPSHLSPV